MNESIIFKLKESQAIPDFLADCPAFSEKSISVTEISEKFPECRYVVVLSDKWNSNEEDYSKFHALLSSCDELCAGFSPSADPKIVSKFEHLVFSLACGGKISEKICEIAAFPIQYWDELKHSLVGKEPLLSLLFQAARGNIPIKDVSIMGTKPIRRSITERISTYFRVFGNSQPLKYLFSSVVAFVIDYTLLMLLSAVLPFASMEIGALLAWCVSSSTNFILNRNFVFMSDTPVKVALLEYYGLATTAFVLKTYVLIELFTRLLHIPLVIAKPIAEVVFYLINYFVQKKLIFKKKSDN